MMNSDEQSTLSQVQALADAMSDKVHVSVSERNGTITFSAPRGNIIRKIIIISLLGILGTWWGIANSNLEVVIVSVGIATAYGLLSEPSYSVLISRQGCKVCTGLLGTGIGVAQRHVLRLFLHTQRGTFHEFRHQSSWTVDPTPLREKYQGMGRPMPILG